MDNYIVSARKYRPATFESVVGQGALTITLKNAVATQKLAHAYLFCGPRGVGKTTCARIFAKTINCTSPTTEGEACNRCESCTAFNEQRSYNIHELDAASNNSVDDIRQLVDQVRIPPQIGRYKVYIIDEVHMLSASAFNAFLKTLEEPPRHAVFILATTEKHKILPTILSRCQIYDFNRIGVEDTVAHLAYVASREGIKAEPEALNVIALKADGGMRDALSIFDQVVSFTGGNITYDSVIENLNVLDYEYYFRLTDHFLGNDVGNALLLFNDILNKGFDGSHFITGLSSHFRDLLVSKDESTLELLEVGAGIRRRYLEQSRECPLSFLYRAMKLSNECDLNYRSSKNKRLLVELTLIQIAQLTVESTDDSSGGRSPKPIIKPIFTPAVPAQQEQPPQPKVVQAAPDARPEVAPQSPSAPPAAEHNRKVPVMKKGGLGVSIKQASQEEDATPSRIMPATAENPDTTPLAEDRPFNERELNLYWQEYAGQLPQEQTAIATQMKGLTAKLLEDGSTFEITVENEIAAKHFNAIVPPLQDYLRLQLKNRKIKMTVKVSETPEAVRPLGRVEHFRSMEQKNKALTNLKDVFGLEFY